MTATNAPENGTRTGTVEVPLTKGKVAIIDEADDKRVLAYSWCAMVTKKGKWYAKRKIIIDGKHTSQLLHRFILDAPAGVDVDHRNGDGLDCRRDNLRKASPSQNAANRSTKEHTSRYKGVSWDKRAARWRADLRYGYRSITLGRFESEEDAARAYDRAARRYHGVFARLNFPDEEAGEISAIRQEVA